MAEGRDGWTSAPGCTDPNCGNPYCPSRGNGGQQTPTLDWGPPVPDVPPFQITDPPEEPDRLPLVPVERDREYLDRLESLTEKVEFNAESIRDLLNIDRLAAEKDGTLRELIGNLQQQIEEHSHETAEPNIDALTALVIAKLLKEGRSEPGGEPTPLDALVRAMGPIDVEQVDIDTGKSTLIPVYLGEGFTIFSTDPK